jgi:hypothetical protein
VAPAISRLPVLNLSTIFVYQKLDFAYYLKCFHDDASIRVYRTDAATRVEYSKAQYERYIAEGRYTDKPTKLYNPNIMVMGDRATLKCQNDVGVPIKTTIDMVKENENWFIKRYDWTYRGE